MKLRPTPRHRSVRGSSATEHLVLVLVVALVGSGALSALGTAFRADVSGAATSAAVETSSASVSSQAGLASTLAHIRELPARAVTVARDFFHPNVLMDPSFVVPWDKIKAEDVDRAVARAIRISDRERRASISRFRNRSASKLVRKLDSNGEAIGYVAGILSHLEDVVDDEALFAATKRMQDVLSERAERFATDNRLWRKLQRIEGSRSARKLEGEEARVFQQILDAERRGGADLPDADKLRLAAIGTELTDLTRTFGKHIVDAETSYEYFVDDVASLDGMSEEYIARAHASAESVGKPGYRLTKYEGTFDQAMETVHDESVRRGIFESVQGLYSSGEYDNYPIAERVLVLRREASKILGFENYADRATVTRMVQNGENAEKFIDDLAARTKPFLDKEFEEFRAFRRSIDGKDTFEKWDGAYWAKRYSDTFAKTDEVKAFFPVDTVLDGVFETAHRIYGVKFEETTMPIWHPDVRSFLVLDEDGRHLGTFQVDLFKRAGKRQGGWHNSMNLGLGEDPTYSIIVANFDPPLGSKPALLTMDEVETVFHEFGHGLHNLFSEAELDSLGGTKVARDFVELPSQIMENFAWEPVVLDYLAKHHETGEHFPAALLENLKASRRADAASVQMRQLALSKLDLALHRHYDPAVHGDLKEYARELLAPMRAEGSPSDPSLVLPRFNHIFAGGYASGYYGYKWAEVLDADAFTRFREDGVLSRRVGDQFRREVLSKGDTADADVLFRNFMGRDPDPEALQRRLGFTAN